MSTTPITTPTPSIPSPLTGKTTTAKDPLTDKSTFIQLLVAQLKNQNPLNPADGTQFVTQLAQFTTLEQSLQMNSSLTAIRNVLAPTTAPTSDTNSK